MFQIETPGVLNPTISREAHAKVSHSKILADFFCSSKISLMKKKKMHAKRSGN
jgi:hypothetical protein